MILITGAKGLLGQEFVHRIPATEVLSPSKEELDITSWHSLQNYVRGKKIDFIINCAADRYAEIIQEHPGQSRAVSIDGPRNLAEFARDNGAALIHFSTDYVFDGKSNIPYKEQDPTGPLSAYAQLKRLGEEAVLKAGGTVLVIRTAWLFSAYGKDFVKTIRSLAQKNKEIRVVFDQVGSPCYAGDLARWVVEMLPQIKSGTREIYHLTNEGVCSWYDLAYLTVKGFGLATQVVPIHTHEYPQKAIRPHYSVLDKSKIKRDFNLQLRHYSEGLNECIQQILRNEME